MIKAQQRVIDRKKRAFRVKKSLTGTAQRPRFCVRRSLKHVYAQLIDDIEGRSVIQVGSNGQDITGRLQDSEGANKTKKAKMVGEILAEKALEQGVSQVVFDRKGYLFRGRVKAVADGAREKGLRF